MAAAKGVGRATAPAGEWAAADRAYARLWVACRRVGARQRRPPWGSHRPSGPGPVPVRGGRPRGLARGWGRAWGSGTVGLERPRLGRAAVARNSKDTRLCAPPQYCLVLYFSLFFYERPLLALCAPFMRLCASGTLMCSLTWVRARRQHVLLRAQPVHSCPACPVIMTIGSGTAVRATSVCRPRIYISDVRLVLQCSQETTPLA